MEHIAIMKKSWNLIPKILSGEKSIESRWYQTRRTPWDKISMGDKIFFKNSGEPIIASAIVSEVTQFKIDSIIDVESILKKFGKEICLVNTNPKMWGRLPKYCILIRLHSPKLLKASFQINRKGFGSGAAWITVSNVSQYEK